MYESGKYIKCLDDCPVNGPHNCVWPWRCLSLEEKNLHPPTQQGILETQDIKD
jgi:hypothetical protein